jgi:hypothetical protein
VNSLGDEAMGLASTEPTDKGELAVFRVVAERDLMREQALANAGQSCAGGPVS